MAGGGGGERGAVSSEPNVVPMIDILLVLLIIFMITQPLSRMAIDVQVPPPEQTTVQQQQNNQIVLELADDGGYAINGQPVPKDQLDTQIHAIFDPRPAKLLAAHTSLWELLLLQVATVGHRLPNLDVADSGPADVLRLTARAEDEQEPDYRARDRHDRGDRADVREGALSRALRRR